MTAPWAAGASIRIGGTTAVRLAALLVGLAAFVLVLGPPRRLAQRFGWRLGERTPVLFQRLLCAGLGVRVRSHGEIGASGARLIVANHVSWLDIPVMGSLAPMSFLAKKEIGGNLLGRELAALQGVVYVDRGRRGCIPEVNARMIETMRAGSAVVLFAEATTGDGNRLLRFRSSHFEAIRRAAAEDGVPATIQPAYLHYSRLGGLPLSRLVRPRVAWYGDTTFLPHFARFARGAGVACDVYWGEPIPVGPATDRKTAARQTEAAVRKLATAARSGRAVLSAGPEKA